MKRLITVLTMSIFAVLLCAGLLFAADSEASRDVRSSGPSYTALQGIDRIETIVYGSPQAGGLLPRLAKAETDLFGRELPGSLTERQQALQNFVEDGSATQPSLLFKTAVAEWVTLHRTNPSRPMTDRVSHLETTLEDQLQTGALSARLERILAKLLPGGVSAMNVQVPAHTVLKAKFMETLTVRNVKRGDLIELELAEDCIISGTLAASTGNRIFAEVTRVRMPRSFGRPSEIGVEFQNVEALDGHMAAVYIGPAAKKAMEIDSAAVGAGAASLVGAVLIGPVGLAGGFLVRGSDKQLPEGTLVYVETTEQTGVLGFQVPTSMGGVVEPETLAPQGTVPQNPPN